MLNYTVEQAREIAAKPEGHDSLEYLMALKVLSVPEEETSYRKICDAFVESEKRKGEEEPLAELEWMLMCSDHGFSRVMSVVDRSNAGIPTPRLPIGRSQAFFNRLYGGHFYPAEIYVTQSEAKA